MKRLFVRENAVSSDAPADTPPSPTVVSNSIASPQPGAETDIAQRLQGAMERAALKLIEKDDLTPKELKEALDLSERLLKQRKSIAEESAREDGAGVEALRELMDPAKAVERHHKDPMFRTALVAKGWLPPEERRPGRLSPESQKLRDDRDRRKRALQGAPPPEADDTGLREMIGDI